MSDLGTAFKYYKDRFHFEGLNLKPNCSIEDAENAFKNKILSIKNSINDLVKRNEAYVIACRDFFYVLSRLGKEYVDVDKDILSIFNGDLDIGTILSVKKKIDSIKICEGSLYIFNDSSRTNKVVTNNNNKANNVEPVSSSKSNTYKKTDTNSTEQQRVVSKDALTSVPSNKTTVSNLSSSAGYSIVDSSDDDILRFDTYSMFKILDYKNVRDNYIKAIYDIKGRFVNRKFLEEINRYMDKFFDYINSDIGNVYDVMEIVNLANFFICDDYNLEESVKYGLRHLMSVALLHSALINEECEKIRNYFKDVSSLSSLEVSDYNLKWDALTSFAKLTLLKCGESLYNDFLVRLLVNKYGLNISYDDKNGSICLNVRRMQGKNLKK